MGTPDPTVRILKNFRVIDETMDALGSVVIEDGLIRDVIPGEADGRLAPYLAAAELVLDGSLLAAGGAPPVLMPAFTDLHAHFRDPGFPEKETLESASLAAAGGGYGTVVCMANTNPVLDTAEGAAALKARSDALALIDLYPVLALTKGMAGRELSGIRDLPDRNGAALPYFPRLLSEDGKDVNDDGLFLAAFAEARRLGLPVSCHCDFGGEEAEAAKKAGQPRAIWSRIEENNGTRRAIALGKRAGCHVHIAHVSTKEAAELIREAKAGTGGTGFTLTCEATPHHIALTEARAIELGDESWGRVNPPLRTGEDRQAIIAALLDGTIDAIATDHAPHSKDDKAKGAPGFTGLETGFSVCFTELVQNGRMSLSRLSALMSAAPSRILDLQDRGRIAPGLRADLVIADTGMQGIPDAACVRSRGKNAPFNNMNLTGTILMTLQRGRIIFDRRDSCTIWTRSMRR
ncbi:dihydroorotase [Spirochaetia bacterium]|nr:dihydroorotase [Spirochaetia bacterium]